MPAFRPFAFALLAAAFPLAAAAQSTLNTVQRGFLPLSSPSGLRDVDGFRIGAARFAVVCRGSAGVDIVNTQNPAALSVTAHLASAGGDAVDAATLGTALYVAHTTGGVTVVDVSTPAAPVVVTTLPASGENLFIADGILYLARGTSGSGELLSYDLATPLAPQIISTYDTGLDFRCRDVHARHGRIYAFNDVPAGGETRILDATTPSSPFQIGAIAGSGLAGWEYDPPGGAARVLATCSTAVGGPLRTWDVTDPGQPYLLGSFPVSATVAVHNVEMTGTRFAFLTAFADGLRVLDLANPSDAPTVGYFDPRPSNALVPNFVGTYGVFAESETRLYLTEMQTIGAVQQGLFVVDFNPGTTFRLDLTTSGVGDALLLETGAPPGAYIANILSTYTAFPFSTGPIVGLANDSLQSFLIGFPPFATYADQAGGYSFAIPPGGLPSGVWFDVRGITVLTTGYALTEIARITF